VEHAIHPKYRADIDGLRAVAVLSVVGFHAFPNVFSGGFVGVDVFFVISGFLISTIIFGDLDAGRFDFVGFYSRRVRRIFPSLIVVLIASLAFGWLALLASDYAELGKQVAAGAGFVANVLFLNESGYFDVAAQYKPMLHLWSLGIEEQFYILWPLLLWSAWKRHINLLGLTVGMAAISFYLNDSGMNDVAWAYYSPITRFWELLAGCALAYVTLHPRHFRIKARQFLTRGRQLVGASPNYFTQAFMSAETWTRVRALQSIAGVGLILVAVFGLRAHEAFSPWMAVMPTLGAVLLISAGAPALCNRVILSNRMMVWFGLISFPLYLWHWPLLSFASISEPAQSFGIRPPRIADGTAAFMVGLSVVLAWLTYSFVERPVRFSTRGRLLAPMLCLLTLVAGSMGYVVFAADGFPARYPQKPWMNHVGTQLFVREWRAHSCFLEVVDNFTEDCVDTDKRPLYFLWGDSQSAALYPGLKWLQQKYDIGIAQYGYTGCPPFVDFVKRDRPRCKELNDYILDRIRTVKPDVVLLQAHWMLIDSGLYDLGKLENTVRELRKIGINRIVVFGPGPAWSAPLPKLIWTRYYAFHVGSNETPERMSFGVDPDTVEVDRRIEALAKRLGVTYISVFKELCNPSGCLARVDDEDGDLTYYDTVHLSPAGSRLFMRLVAERLYQARW
jgi:peptidoglycan/LPS O-acetylase OafA/YrhL